MSKVEVFTREQAQELADRIIAYWRSRGFHGIRANVRRLNSFGDWTVASNLNARGFPPVSKGRTGRD